MWCDDTIFICTLYKIWIHAKKTTKNNKAYYEYVFRGSCWSQRILVGHIASAICGSKGAVDISEKSFVQPWHVFIKPPDDIETTQLYNCSAHSKAFFWDLGWQWPWSCWPERSDLKASWLKYSSIRRLWSQLTRFSRLLITERHHLIKDNCGRVCFMKTTWSQSCLKRNLIKGLFALSKVLTGLCQPIPNH